MTYVNCSLCDSPPIPVPEWPDHRDVHIRHALEHPDDPIRFCQDGSPVNIVIVCRQRMGHRGTHAGPLRELTWV